ncbi:MAG: cytochrome b related protein [Thermoplasmatales archaeon I-plasma]|nr:MAG: cytochrome b related protein [Thermoplasmatales archaeon I-plasma]
MSSIKERIEKAKLKGSGASEWLIDRTQLEKLPLRKTPDYMRKWGGKWYWTGALITIAFTYEVLTGLILLLYYNPSSPYTSTTYILDSVPFGKLILSTHLYGAYAMIILVYVHMFRNYFVGAYKKPRELQWIIGVILLALTIGAGYFGYSLTGDVLSYDAQDVGRGIASLIPGIGQWLAAVGFGNGTAASLFSKFLGYHIIMAALIALLFGYHFYLAEANTMLPSSKISKYKAPATTPETHEMKPWYPSNLLYLVELGLLTIGFIILIPSFVGLIPNTPILISPFPGPSPTSAAAALIPAYPPWFLLFLYKAVDFGMFTNAMGPLNASIVFGLLPLIYFLLIPFLDSGNSLHPLDRPITTSLGIISIVYLILLSVWGAFEPGVIIPSPTVALVLLPPAIITFIAIFGISKLWKKGKLKIGGKTTTTSFFIFIIGLVITVILTGYSFTYFITHFSVLALGKVAISGTALGFLAIGTARTAEQLPDKKLNKIPLGAYVSIGLLTLMSWVLLGLSLKLNPTSDAMVVGMALGTVLIFSGIALAIYRRVIFGE